MSFSFEKPRKLSQQDKEAAARLTAAGFGREADQHNYADTQAHLESADYLQIVRMDKELVGFAAYRRLLWRACS